MRLVDPVSFSFAWITLSLSVTATAIGQVPDTVRRRPAVVVGQVVDSAGGRIDGAEIMVLAGDGDEPVVAPTTSDSQGNFRVSALPPGGPYTFVARKMGYKPSRGGGITIAAGDTRRLRFVLNPLVAILAPITVKGRRRDRNALYADEFAKKIKDYRDLLDLVAWRRPFILGDPHACSPLDSLGNVVPDREPRIRVTRNLMIGSGQGRARRRPADAVRLGNGFDEPRLTFVRHVYVNGMRVTEIGDPIRTPARMLRTIPMRHVAEMHYVDCWDHSVPIHMQYSIFVTLKPLPPQQADSIYRFILAQAAAAGPVGGRVLSVKRPSREQWDSLVRLLTGRDSVPGDSASAAAP